MPNVATFGQNGWPANSQWDKSTKASTVFLRLIENHGHQVELTTETNDGVAAAQAET